MGSDYSHKNIRLKREKRKSGNKGMLPDSIFIICEGEQTEKKYFDALITANRLLTVSAEGYGMNTDSLVKLAIKKSKEENFDQIWCVFDRDSFPKQNFNRAFLLAKKHNKIKIAYSNEAFELWYLLHFHYFNTGISRDQYKDKLSKELGYKYEKNSKTMYEILKDKQAIAIKHAKNLLKSYTEFNPEKNNPSTTVHLLVQELNKQKGS